MTTDLVHCGWPSRRTCEVWATSTANRCVAGAGDIRPKRRISVVDGEDAETTTMMQINHRVQNVLLLPLPLPLLQPLQLQPKSTKSDLGGREFQTFHRFPVHRPSDKRPSSFCLLPITSYPVEKARRQSVAEEEVEARDRAIGDEAAGDADVKSKEEEGRAGSRQRDGGDVEMM